MAISDLAVGMQQNGVSGGRWEMHHSAIRKRLDEVWGCSFEDYYKTITSASPNAPQLSPTKTAIVSPVKGVLDVCRLKSGGRISESCRSTPNGKWRGMAENGGSRKRAANGHDSGWNAKKPRDEIGHMLDEFTSLPPLLSPLREVAGTHSAHSDPRHQPPPKPQSKPTPKPSEKESASASNKEPRSKPPPPHASLADKGRLGISGETPLEPAPPKRLNGHVVATSRTDGMACKLSLTSIPRERRKLLYERWKTRGVGKASPREVKPEEAGSAEGAPKSDANASDNMPKRLKTADKERGTSETDSRSTTRLYDKLDIAKEASQSLSKATASARDAPTSSNGAHQRSLGDNPKPAVEIPGGESTPKPQSKFSSEGTVEVKRVKTAKKERGTGETESGSTTKGESKLDVVQGDSHLLTKATAGSRHAPHSSNGVHPCPLGDQPKPVVEIPDGESAPKPQSKFSLEEALEARKRTSEGYRNAARTIKHKADKTPDRTQKTLLYLEATLYFALSAIAERGADTEKPIQPQQPYLPLSRSLDFLRSSTSTFANSKPDSQHTRRYRRRVKFLGSLLDACLSYQLYKLRSEEAYKNYSLLKEHQRAEKTVERHDATPSPASTSSLSRPASAKSDGGTASKDMVQLPSSVHQLLLKQNQLLTHLLWAHRLWDEANSTASDENKELLAALSGLCGELKLDSDVRHFVDFFGTATKWMQEQHANELKKFAETGDAKAASP